MDTVHSVAQLRLMARACPGACGPICGQRSLRDSTSTDQLQWESAPFRLARLPGSFELAEGNPVAPLTDGVYEFSLTGCGGDADFVFLDRLGTLAARVTLEWDPLLGDLSLQFFRMDRTAIVGDVDPARSGFRGVSQTASAIFLHAL